MVATCLNISYSVDFRAPCRHKKNLGRTSAAGAEDPSEAYAAACLYRFLTVRSQHMN